MWRGHNWKSSLAELETDANSVGELKMDSEISIENSEGQNQSLTGQELSSSSVSNISAYNSAENQNTSTSTLDREDVELLEESREYTEEGTDCHEPSVSSESPESLTAAPDVYNCEEPLSRAGPIAEQESMLDISASKTDVDEHEVAEGLDGLNSHHDDLENMPPGSEGKPGNDKHSELSGLVLKNVSEDNSSGNDTPSISLSPSMEGVLLLRSQAVESGSAFVLDNTSLDADSVYERAVALAQTAPPGPVFSLRPKRWINKKSQEQPTDDLEVKETVRCSDEEVGVPRSKESKKRSKNQNTKDIREDCLNVIPRGSLGVDELAKLLS